MFLNVTPSGTMCWFIVKVVYHSDVSKQQLGQGVWYDPEGTGYIMLDVSQKVTHLEPKVVRGIELFPKTEYHCSLVAARKLACDDRTIEAEIVHNIEQCLKTNKIQLIGLTNNYFFCQKVKQDGRNESTVIAKSLIR